MRSYRVSPLAPKSPLEAWGYSVCQSTFGLLLRTLFRMRFADVRPLPDGPLILAANHRSFIDPGVLGAIADRPIIYMMHAKYYDLKLLNWFFRMSRCIVVDEAADTRAALRASEEVLRQGGVLGIFPEGHISKDGTLQPPQPGIAWLARRTGAPVIPVYLGGTREVLPRGSKRLRIRPVRVAMGQPLQALDYPAGRAGEQRFANDVMAAIARLGGVAPPLLPGAVDVRRSSN
jgi:1-acyl-sn-glycerol-3-phosphate acyltransferase